MESEVRNTMPDLPPTSEIARLARSPSALLNHLSNMAPDEEPDRDVPTPRTLPQPAGAPGRGAAGIGRADPPASDRG